MKTLLVGLNSKYIHSNLAIYYLKAYAEEYSQYTKLMEYTINQSVQNILESIYKEKADIVAFSCYIWNIAMIKEIIIELKKVQPGIKIWMGGPEVSYDSHEVMNKIPQVDGIMIGEGEETFKEVLRHYIDKDISLKGIKGISYRENGDGEKVISNGIRPQMDMSTIPFPYDKIDEFENKIIYYESSRGCPFSCSYCLSSIDRGVRLRDIELVKEEIKNFLDHHVKQVKFIDRTFNCNKEHALEVWKFIKENDNGITNFHFEISADIISEEEIELLSTFRPGHIQFEIGVQSTNPKTITAINRSMDFSKLTEVVGKLQESNNIHLHLDLIAGLPEEDFKTFTKSFNDVYLLRPEKLQLGFLKLLKGSSLEMKSGEYGIITTDAPPYEVLFTNWLNYEELIRLKAIEDMVDIYHNTGQFTYSVLFLEHFFEEPIDFYNALSVEYEGKGLDQVSHSRLRRYEILLDFFSDIVMVKQGLDEEYYDLFEEILLYDLYLRENLKNRPEFIKNQRDYRQIHRKFYHETEYKRASSHLEYFEYDIEKSVASGKKIRFESQVIFDYNNRSPLNKAAKTTVLRRDENE